MPVVNKKDPAVPEYHSTVIIDEAKDRKTAIARKDQTTSVAIVNSSHSIENYPEDNNICLI